MALWPPTVHVGFPYDARMRIAIPICSLVTSGELLCLFGPLIGAVFGLHAPRQHVLEDAVGKQFPLGVPDRLERHDLVHGERILEVGGHVGWIGAPGYERG